PETPCPYRCLSANQSSRARHTAPTIEIMGCGNKERQGGGRVCSVQQLHLRRLCRRWRLCLYRSRCMSLCQVFSFLMSHVSGLLKVQQQQQVNQAPFGSR